MEGNGIANPRIEYGVVIAKRVPFRHCEERSDVATLSSPPLRGLTGVCNG